MRYVLIALVALFLIITGIVIFRGGRDAPSPSSTQELLPLPDYANTNAAVSLTTQGIVNGDEIHRQIRITVGRDLRSIEIIQGYSDVVIDRREFYNTLNAYDVFLRAINYQNFLSARKNVKNPDERGQCPLGNKFVFELNQDGEQLSRLWSSTCGDSVGTFAGRTNTLRTLFQAQIPEYGTITSGVSLNTR